MATRTYKNKLNQPLPVTLNSNSLSVGAKAKFNVEEDDWRSPHLITLEGKHLLEMVSENADVEVKDEAESESNQEAQPVVPVDGTLDGTGDKPDSDENGPTNETLDGTGDKPSSDVNGDEMDNKGDDSLTNGSEKAELDRGDADPPLAMETVPRKKKKKRQGSKEGSKKTASREKARS